MAGGWQVANRAFNLKKVLLKKSQSILQSKQVL
jgi:hypothetical protein